VHRIDNERHRSEAHPLAQLLNSSTSTQQRRRRGIKGGGGKLGLGFRRLSGLSVWARVEEVLGWRPAINSPGRTLGVRATHGEACTGQTWAAAAESGAGTA
jgi:hypothetical protein